MRIVATPPSGGKKPTTPTIGTATDGGTGTSVSVAFTPSTYIGKSTITYTATSSPGSLTGTGSGSPITVSGLTTGTAYTFTVAGTTAYGVASNSSAASNSVTPATPSSFESIASATGTGSSGTITFSSIPSTYQHLQLRIMAKSTHATAQNVYCDLTFNANSTAIYSYHTLLGDGTSATAAGTASTTSLQTLLEIPASSATVLPAFEVAIIDIQNYASTTQYKTVRSISGYNSNTTSVDEQEIKLGSGLFQTTTAISRIDLVVGVSSWTATSTFALYGIKGA